MFKFNYSRKMCFKVPFQQEVHQRITDKTILFTLKANIQATNLLSFLACISEKLAEWFHAPLNIWGCVLNHCRTVAPRNTSPTSTSGRPGPPTATPSKLTSAIPEILRDKSFVVSARETDVPTLRHTTETQLFHGHLQQTSAEFTIHPQKKRPTCPSYPHDGAFSVKPERFRFKMIKQKPLVRFIPYTQMT